MKGISIKEHAEFTEMKLEKLNTEFRKLEITDQEYYTRLRTLLRYLLDAILDRKM
jgi:hypothetical protein